MTLINGPKVRLLDYGYMQLIETWGRDESIIEAARMSVDKGFLGWDPGPCPVCEGRGSDLAPHPRAILTPCISCDGKGHIRGDQKLLEWLYSHKHATPFEFAGMIIEIQAPIFLFREWHRHRTQSYAEMSARYVPLPDFNYIPTVERLLINSKTNKQAGTVKDAEVLTEESAELYREMLEAQYREDQYFYEKALRMGVPKELARVHLPVGRYSRMRAQANLRNWIGFLTLREAPGAQWEIRQYAHEASRLIAEHFSRTHGLYIGDVKRAA